MNLPGATDYDPSLPWVSKVRASDGRIASDLFIYVDDLRPTDPSSRECWNAGRRCGSVLSYLGLKNAARKRRESSRKPGAWVGSLLRSEKTGIYTLTLQEKWDKTKRLAKETETLLRDNLSNIPRKRLEQIRGFLMYVTRTYPGLTPYMIGFHLTIDSWRAHRDGEGWKLIGWARRVSEELAELEGHVDAEDGDEGLTPNSGAGAGAPLTVTAVPRLCTDVEALLRLTNSLAPPLRKVRASKTAPALYGFDDASGRGFGATLQIGKKLYYEFGQWKAADAFGTLSN
jgi:hypothetical protein